MNRCDALLRLKEQDLPADSVSGFTTHSALLKAIVATAKRKTEDFAKVFPRGVQSGSEEAVRHTLAFLARACMETREDFSVVVKARSVRYFVECGRSIVSARLGITSLVERQFPKA